MHCIINKIYQWENGTLQTYWFYGKFCLKTLLLLDFHNSLKFGNKLWSSIPSSPPPPPPKLILGPQPISQLFATTLAWQIVNDQISLTHRLIIFSSPLTLWHVTVVAKSCITIYGAILFSLPPWSTSLKVKWPLNQMGVYDQINIVIVFL